MSLFTTIDDGILYPGNTEAERHREVRDIEIGHLYSTPVLFSINFQDMRRLLPPRPPNGHGPNGRSWDCLSHQARRPVPISPFWQALCCGHAGHQDKEVGFEPGIWIPRPRHLACPLPVNREHAPWTRAMTPKEARGTVQIWEMGWAEERRLTYVECGTADRPSPGRLPGHTDY